MAACACAPVQVLYEYCVRTSEIQYGRISYMYSQEEFQEAPRPPYRSNAAHGASAVHLAVRASVSCLSQAIIAVSHCGNIRRRCCIHRIGRSLPQPLNPRLTRRSCRNLPHAPCQPEAPDLAKSGRYRGTVRVDHIVLVSPCSPSGPERCSWHAQRPTLRGCHAARTSRDSVATSAATSDERSRISDGCMDASSRYSIIC